MDNNKQKAWFWWCPIYWDGKNNEIWPRNYGSFWFLLLDITLFLHHSMLVISDFIGIDVDKSYPIRLVK